MRNGAANSYTLSAQLRILFFIQRQPGTGEFNSLLDTLQTLSSNILFMFDRRKIPKIILCEARGAEAL